MSCMFSTMPARQRWLPAVAAVLVLSPAWAQPQALTLDDALKQALQRAPVLEARREQLRAAQEESVRAGALPDPQLTVGIDNWDVQGPGAFTAGGDPMTMRVVGVSQAFPSPGKRRAEKALGAANTTLARSAQAATAVEIRQEVADAWIAAWGAQEERAMLEALAGAWAEDAAVAEARMKGGTGNAADVLAARMEGLELANRIDAIAGEEAQAHARLARWLGQPTEHLGRAPDFSAAPLGEGALLARLDTQGPLLSWPAREQMAEAALEEARADRFPQWAVGMSYGERARGLSDMVSVQLSVSVPLFPHNRQDRGIAARAADLAAVRAEHEDARRQQAERVQSAWAQWQALGQQMQRSREVILPLALDRSTLALAAYRGGGDIQPLLEARRDELAHHAEYAQLKADYGHAWAALAFLLPEQELP